MSSISPGMAAGIFSGLWLSVREADFVGWFRDGRIAAAVLTQGAELPSPGVSRLIGGRIVETLHTRLPGDAARDVRVRVLQLPPRPAR